jgi:hypothetical protein
METCAPFSMGKALHFHLLAEAYALIPHRRWLKILKLLYEFIKFQSRVAEFLKSCFSGTE